MHFFLVGKATLLAFHSFWHSLIYSLISKKSILQRRETCSISFSHAFHDFHVINDFEELGLPVCFFLVVFWYCRSLKKLLLITLKPSSLLFVPSLLLELYKSWHLNMWFLSILYSIVFSIVCFNLHKYGSLDLFLFLFALCCDWCRNFYFVGVNRGLCSLWCRK